MTVWEAQVKTPEGGEFRAQGTGTAAELVLRLWEDDPVWKGTVELRRTAAWPAEEFRSGLAIRFSAATV